MRWGRPLESSLLTKRGQEGGHAGPIESASFPRKGHLKSLRSSCPHTWESIQRLHPRLQDNDLQAESSISAAAGKARRPSANVENILPSDMPGTRTRLSAFILLRVNLSTRSGFHRGGAALGNAPEQSSNPVPSQPRDSGCRGLRAGARCLCPSLPFLAPDLGAPGPPAHGVL